MDQGAAHTQLSPIVRELSNGLSVILEALPHVHSATIGVWIRTGSANERAEVAGISHFLEHLFFKGTETRTTQELMHAIESRGGQLNAFTSREYTCLYVKCLDRHVGTAITILGDIVNHSTFRDLEKERNVILEEIASGVDVPEEYAHDLLTLRLWPDHPLGRPIAGFAESVSAISLPDIKVYRDTWYRPENMVVSIAGKIDEETVFRQIQDEFEGIPAGPPEDLVPAPEFSAGVDVVERDIAQNHLAFAFPGKTLTDPRRYVYDMLSSTLGGGSTSRLFNSIREDAGLAYSIYAFHSAYVSAGMLGVYAAIAPENLDQTLTLISTELAKLRDTPLDDEELESNAEQLKGGLLIAMEGTFSRMSRMARSLIFFDRVMTIEEILEGVDAVTAGNIQELAQQTFTKDRYAMAILGPVDGKSTELGL